jgi:hypothetical protein
MEGVHLMGGASTSDESHYVPSFVSGWREKRNEMQRVAVPLDSRNLEWFAICFVPSAHNKVSTHNFDPLDDRSLVDRAVYYLPNPHEWMARPQAHGTRF